MFILTKGAEQHTLYKPTVLRREPFLPKCPNCFIRSFRLLMIYMLCTDSPQRIISLCICVGCLLVALWVARQLAARRPKPIKQHTTRPSALLQLVWSLVFGKFPLIGHLYSSVRCECIVVTFSAVASAVRRAFSSCSLAADSWETG